MSRKKAGGHPRRMLRPNELRRAAFACFHNARELLVEAELLAVNGHHARALALAATGMQELGKAKYCAGLFVGNSEADEFKEPKKFWKEWAHHQRKGRQALLITALDSWSAVAFGTPEIAEHYGVVLEELRKQALYVDARELIPPTRPDREPPKEPSSGWPVDFLLPWKTCRDIHSQSLTEHLRRNIDSLAPKIESMRQAAEAEAETFAKELADEYERRCGTRLKVERLEDE